MFQVQAPGKLILFGEHSVVYGKRAIATAVGLHTHCHIEASESLELELLDFGFKHCFKDPVVTEDQQVKVAVNAFLRIVKELDIDGCRLTVKSEIPIGSGLGSSASYSVVMCCALLLFKGEIELPLDQRDKQKINDYAFMSEQVIHNNPSGLDNTIATFGRSRLFRKNGKLEEIKDVDRFQFLLINSRVPKNTKHQVNQVKSRQETFEKPMNAILDAMDLIVENVCDVLKSGDQVKLGQLIQMNHQLLNCIGVGHEKLEIIRRICQEFDCPSKITGAGGGGFMLSLVKKNVTDLVQELETNGFDAFETSLGGEGVQASKTKQSSDKFKRIHRL
ncbi:ribosomal protein S5 domain 2-type protein [Gorgonomyces haynaldii]|nr:ribosomal protein S5 domain 2-type protein [Gorgonomyces haynaldii]